MKKIVIFFVGVLGAAALLSADPVIVTGDIEDVVIGNLFDLDVDNYRMNPANDADFTGAIGSNVAFGTVDLTSAGIFGADPDSADYDANHYTAVAHRAGNRYTLANLTVNNNNKSTFQVSATFNGTIFDIPLPVGAAGKDQGNSVMHLTAGSQVNSSNVKTTQFQGNIVQEDVSRSVLRNTAINIYRNATSGIISDSFRAYVALDFLPLVIPVGSYDGTVTWTLTSSIS